MLQGMLDERAHLHVALSLAHRQHATLAAAPRDSWMPPFGPSDELLTGRKGSYLADEFLDCLRDLGVLQGRGHHAGHRPQHGAHWEYLRLPGSEQPRPAQWSEHPHVRVRTRTSPPW